jgi:protein-tyrosine phosphatase
LTPHLGDASDIEQYGVVLDAMSAKLVRKLWPGPVAISFEVPADRQQTAARELGITSDTVYSDGRITLRCPDDPFTLDILRQAEQPVILTRAGLGKGASSQAPDDADVDLIIDAGPTRYRRPSTMIRIEGDSWEVVREGIYDQRIVEKLLRTTVLFVCSGNTCRSPMAMVIGREKLAKMLGTTTENLGDKGFEVLSAGTGAMPGMRATPAAEEAVKTFGGDLASHRSSPLDVALIHRSDLIITMTESHRRGVLGMVPSADTKTVMLDAKGDIDDPIGSDASHYQTLANRMESLVEDRLREANLV